MLYTKYAWSVFLHLSLTILAVLSVRDWPHTGTQHGLCRGKAVSAETSALCVGGPAHWCDLLELPRSRGWPGWNQAWNWNNGNVLLEGRCFPKSSVFHHLLWFFSFLVCKVLVWKQRKIFSKRCRFGSFWGSFSRVGLTVCKTAQPLCHCRQWFTSKILRSNF